MKKILSFVLVLAMIASMMCISVSAAGSAQDTDFVGSNDSNQGEAAEDAEKSTDPISVVATLASTVTNRYAVDITYTISDIVIDGNAIWNVKTLQYENDSQDPITITGYDNVTVTPTADNLSKLPASVQVGEFTLTNYSDLSVYASATIDFPINDTDSSVNMKGTIVTQNTIVAVGDDSDISDDEINGAYDGASAAVGSAKAKTYEAHISSDNWAYVISRLNLTNAQSGNGQNRTYTIAKITISVSSEN